LTAAPRRPWLRRADAVGRWLENLLLTLLLGSLVLLAVAQIVLRNVFSVGLVWADGFNRVTVLWIAVVGAIAASRDHRHIAINLARRVLSTAWVRRAELVVDLFAAGVAGTLAYYCWVFVRDSHDFGDVLLGGWPAWIFQAVLPVGFALIAYRYLLRALGVGSGVDR
jgi:TRAP-type C4-dicarboxylate transport system permease small subunit